MTLKQTKSFWIAFAEACKVLELDGSAAREAYRKQAMAEELNVEHISQIDNKGGYERIMARFWSDAGRYEMAGRYMVGDAKRLGYLVADCCEQVAALCETVAPDVDAYVLGILKQAGITVRQERNEWWMDIPEDVTRSVFQILDTHRRRLLRRFGYHGHMRYSCGMRWAFDDMGQLIPMPPGSITLIPRYHCA